MASQRCARPEEEIGSREKLPCAAVAVLGLVVVVVNEEGKLIESIRQQKQLCCDFMGQESQLAPR